MSKVGIILSLWCSFKCEPLIPNWNILGWFQWTHLRFKNMRSRCEMRLGDCNISKYIRRWERQRNCMWQFPLLGGSTVIQGTDARARHLSYSFKINKSLQNMWRCVILKSIGFSHSMTGSEPFRKSSHKCNVVACNFKVAWINLMSMNLFISVRSPYK